MAQDKNMTPPPELNAIAMRYPEKTFYLGQAFNNTTNCYKLVWLLALLSLLERDAAMSLRLTAIFNEMAVIGWHPVCLYRLSLGRQDSLQNVVLEIREACGLAPNARPEAIRRVIEGNPAAQANLNFLKNYVPTRFLTPWFTTQLQGMPDTRRDAAIKKLASDSQGTALASMYYFDTIGAVDVIRFNKLWHTFLLENLAVVRTFAEHNFALYLQARNPNTPGVVRKLGAPTTRQLTAARKFWTFVQAELYTSGRHEHFRDIYSNYRLSDEFTIDHFLPWSFVVHDLLWNLVPVAQPTNSSKSDALPDLDLYLPRLAKLHFAAIESAKTRPKLLEDYIDCFKRSPGELLALGEVGLFALYREVMLPQSQIAMNQGFEFGWKLRL